MNKLLPVLAAISMISSNFLLADVQIAATDSSVRWMGRTAVDQNGVTLAFPGIETVLRFSGSSLISVSGKVLNEKGWFNAYIDGKALPMLVIEQGDFDISLAVELDKEAEHTLRLVRRSEAWEGLVTISNFALDDGAETLAPLPLPERKIMAIGDSITCGHNIELTDVNRPGNINSNAELAYGWCLARDFNAQVNLVSYGGKGIIRDWQGLTTELTAGEFFERALPDDASSVWDHNSYQPDLILICLGQNDYSSVLIPAWDYAQAYIKLIDRIHEVHPQAKIVIMSSPMGENSRTDGTQPRNKILEVALSLVEQNYLAKGELFVRPFFVKHYNGTHIDSHPIVPQQRAIADDLMPLIKAWMNW